MLCQLYQLSQLSQALIYIRSGALNAPITSIAGDITSNITNKISCKISSDLAGYISGNISIDILSGIASDFTTSPLGLGRFSKLP